MQNTPNPFTDNTIISFTIPVKEKVTITIFDLFGKIIQEFSGIYQRGTHSINWNGSDMNKNKLSVGSYYYRMQSGEFVEVKKMILFK